MMQRAFGLNIPQTLEDVCDASRLALIVYDMQVGIAMEIGSDPTVRHGADIGYVPVVMKDACGDGHGDAAERSHAGLEFAGDALYTSVDGLCAQFGRISQ